MPLSSFENMKMELAWRFQDLFIQFWEMDDALKDLKVIFSTYNLDDSHNLPPPFDPLRTVGKYE
jgi:hypothetical protein